MTKIEITVGTEAISFAYFQDWVNHAQDRFRAAGLIGRSHEYICIDRTGNICTCGKNFKTATYPVIVYLIDPASGLPGEQGLYSTSEKGQAE